MEAMEPAEQRPRLPPNATELGLLQAYSDSIVRAGRGAGRRTGVGSSSKGVCPLPGGLHAALNDHRRRLGLPVGKLRGEDFHYTLDSALLSKLDEIDRGWRDLAHQKTSRRLVAARTVRGDALTTGAAEALTSRHDARTSDFYQQREPGAARCAWLLLYARSRQELPAPTMWQHP